LDGDVRGRGLSVRFLVKELVQKKTKVSIFRAVGFLLGGEAERMVLIVGG